MALVSSHQSQIKTQRTGVPLSTLAGVPRPELVHTPSKVKSHGIESVATARDALMNAALEKISARADKCGGSVIHGAKASETVIGLAFEFPVLAYLFQSQSLPLRTVMQLTGPPGGGKSTLLYDFGAFVQRQGGLFHMVEHESKLDTEWVKCLLGDEGYKSFVCALANSPAEWQSHIYHFIDAHTSNEFGDLIPLCLGVDSVTGKTGTGTSAKLSKGEDLGRSFDGATAANANGQAIRSLTTDMNTAPIVLILVNHQAIPMGDNAVAGPITSGGSKLRYQETVELAIERRGNFSQATQKGHCARITCMKNSFGEGAGHRAITTKLSWHYVSDPEAPSGFRQVGRYDWDWSLTRLLLDAYNPDSKGSEMIRAKLKELDVHCALPGGGAPPAGVEPVGRAWSKSLGMSARDPVTWSEMGRMLREDPEHHKRILHAFFAFNRVQMVAGTSFVKLLNSVYHTQIETKAEKKKREKAEKAAAAPPKPVKAEKAKAKAKAEPKAGAPAPAAAKPPTSAPGTPVAASPTRAVPPMRAAPPRPAVR